MSAPVIAIDGPSASGKGTVARRVAAALGFHYLESGALYRLVALESMRRQVAPDARAGLAAIAQNLPAEFRGGKILLSDQDVTKRLTEEDCSERASLIAQLAEVRSALLERQRGFRRAPGLVADGRDMGSVVFPDATLKVYLNASLEVRAQRRYKQLIEKGLDANLAVLSRDLAARDARDANRAVAPLSMAPDAKEIDSSTLSIEAVVEKILRWRQEIQRGR